ncbi:MAG: histidinol-phosphate transaminase [Oscillospiraceae bacterium]
MSKFLSERFSGLAAYVPGEQPKGESFIKLNTNESPYPPSQGVAAAISAEEVSRLRLYGDPESGLLRDAIAERFGVTRANIFAGSGSDEVLSYIFMAFCDAKVGVSYPDISYGFYSVYADLYGIAKNEVALREDFTICAEDYCNAGRTVVIANPNAPTGLCLSYEDIEKIAASNPNNVVAIDEAYIDFGGTSSVPLTKKYDNLLVVHTFSKSRSLAGLRLGYAIGSEALIADLEKLRYSNNPFNINTLTQLAGRAALAEQAYYDKNTAEIILTRDKLTKQLRNLGFFLTDSNTNFVFAKHPKLSGSELYRGLREHGILVRHFNKAKIDEFVRITIGTPEQMEKVLAALKEMVENA